MFKSLKVIILGGVLSLLFTGCGAAYKTVVTPQKDIGKSNVVYIEADQDATALGFLASGGVIRTNYKYSFAIAAQTTKNNGFKYFSIYAPKELIAQYKNKNVSNINDAYLACEEGEGSFNWQFISAGGLKDLPKDIKHAFGGESYRNANNCQNIVKGWHEATIKGTIIHKNIFYTIEMHNENRQDNITFNADEVLKSDLIKDLNKEYFVPMTR